MYCGLIGFNGDPKLLADKNVSKTVLAKLKILGLYNIERGKHSCGLFVDNTLHKGVDNEKLFSDFIVNTEFGLPSPGHNTIIGHTRAATHGIHSFNNAHPFLINDEFVLAHNGVVRNIWELCNRYKIDHSKITVDSLALAHLINQEGFKVLNEYKGFAALLMWKLSDPKSIYVFRGESPTTKDGKFERERPMYYMQSEEGVYFSSLEKSLLAISDSEGDRIKELEANIVHKFTNGKMTKVKFPVDRSTINIGTTIATHGGNPAVNYPKTGSTHVTSTTPTTQHTGNGITNRSDSNKATQDTTTNSCVGRSYVSEPQQNVIAANMLEMEVNQSVPITFHETLPSRAFKYKHAKCDNVFYHMGRHWATDDDVIQIAHGKFYLDKKGRIGAGKTRSNHNYFFYEGVLMSNEGAYQQACTDEQLKDKRYNFAANVSKYAEFPVCNSRSDIAQRCSDCSDYVKYRWYFKTNMVMNTGFTPRFSDRNYTIRNGLLSAISVQKNIDSECINKGSYMAEKGAKLALAKGRFNLNQMNSLEKPDIVKAPGVVVTMPPAKLTHPALENVTNFHQPNIPFPKTEEEEMEKRPPEMDITNFYRTFETLEQINNTLDYTEKAAIKYYVCDIMRHEMQYEPTSIFDNAVEIQTNMFLTMIVDRETTLMELWDDNNYPDVYDYLKLATENTSGMLDSFGKNENKDVDEVEAELVDPADTCEFVPKPIITAETEANPKDDEEPPVLDAYVQEMEAAMNEAGVPGSLQDQRDAVSAALEDYEKEEEISYAIEDIIDNVSDARDCADELVVHDTDLSNDVANLVYKTFDPFFTQLKDVLKKHGEDNEVFYLTERMKALKQPSKNIRSV